MDRCIGNIVESYAEEILQVDRIVSGVGLQVIYNLFFILFPLFLMRSFDLLVL